MLIKTNKNNEITEMVIYGGLEGSFEYNGEIPDDFEEKFKPGFYMLQDDKIIENPNYVEPTNATLATSSNRAQEAIDNLGTMTAKIAKDNMQIKLALDKLGQMVIELQKNKEAK